MPQTTPSPIPILTARSVAVAPAASWLAVSATPARAADGTVATDVVEQAAEAWNNLEHALAEAGYTRADLVSVTQYVTGVDEIPGCELVRSAALGVTRPACTLIVVGALGHPGHRFHIEAWAARTSHRHIDDEESARQAHRSTDLGYRGDYENEAYARQSGDAG
jgi:enamine deaminase RidA (YjgF/YER057c/UK114 family)